MNFVQHVNQVENEEVHEIVLIEHFSIVNEEVLKMEMVKNEIVVDNHGREQI